MRHILIALLVCLLAFSAAVAANEPLNLRTHARAAGLPDSVPVHLHIAAEMNGYYTPGGVACMWIFCQQIPEHIAVFAPAGTPNEKILAVMFHEILHYKWKGIDANAQYEEWSADVFAVQQLCRLGYNGPEVVASVLSWKPWGHDEAHGYSIQRVRHALAQSCSQRGQESP